LRLARGEGGWQLHGRKEPLRSDILIPNHFQEYYEAITDHLKDEYSSTVYVTDSPGLGKSVMMYYSLVHQNLHLNHFSGLSISHIQVEYILNFSSLAKSTPPLDEFKSQNHREYSARPGRRGMMVVD
jgi:hypothetical protein